MVEIKNKIIKEIQNIDDRDVIDEIYRLLEIDFKDEPFQTSNEQKHAVKEARHQYRSRKYIDDAEINRDIDTWLDE